RVPVLLPFPERSLLLVKAAGPAGGAAAIETLRAAMLRMLAALPPGKVRFTIFDPVGLGEGFAGFMHLADHDEQLVTHRIWTEPAHIERRLADLTEHMENVLQAYLRNEFRSLEEYNASAGEMAEPYRVLVVAGFPSHFTETAARRLASIVSSGARCGVFTLMSLHTGAAMPRDFRLADLEPHALILSCSDGNVVWEHETLGAVPLEVDVPPPGESFTRIVRAIGRRVEQAGRVEVPFASIVPEKSSWWTADSRLGLDVPLGRIGGTKCQHLRLGRGTSQHVLVSGKTGSGKSTLLHVLVTSLALHYPPDQVELYLVDFKKGVEFKTYARRRLPHARVVAIESEREFGLSVLERLDAELRARGDLFRAHGVQDLPAFRAAQPARPLPRVLLVVDEFQELFVEDDRVAQKAALLLDRLVRQGRAFGIHVLLGSQTLAGNYSLPRSTLGQMAVRIALQCSEADAHLILSEENTAARLLTRPGEAIYNDANGLYEGNQPFQVVWLPDAERDAYLDQIGELAGREGLASAPAVVFEGNADADPAENPDLGALLASAEWPSSPGVSKAWLGAPVAIQAPTCIEFARAGGNNLLAVGHREEAAAGVLGAAVLSLAAGHRPAFRPDRRPETTFYLFDGARRDAPEAGFWPRVAAALPHGVRVVTPRESAEAIAEIAERLAAREQSDRDDAPPIYLVIHNLSRFHELRKAEDDFGFVRAGGDEPPSPARRFARILRDGPALGIHTLAWCDTYNNVGRWLDRQGLRDMEMRVLFQMNATDSSQLIDSPAASQLGPHRAVLYHEGLGQSEKFRPYAMPSEAWLDRVREQLARKCEATAANAPDAAPPAA
ncbi:MAG: FtsK/SpoIIIE domain-containing protein, partial [Thermoguttaceae bacterium]|nr:FtsK/SpoIIIE domain-containing protein [Thermoguttaceae bacterium]